ncbi:DUF5686 and carboxypeptidase regulatory-like domain-containing protein [Pseudofulvibacter geojedonensis]|uniref:DUF5686 and carboxypeptidase regulatory-like domain-containing protein n=1 Tax=Pseudofulvibacter geojedonensis TaxID=1123758 RepID=A0ABW3HYV6_9FLAO
MKQLLLVFTFLCCFYSYGQIQGIITDIDNNSLAFVNIHAKNTLKGATSNEKGFYEVNINKKGTYTIVFQYLGYKTLKKEVQINSFPYVLNIQLKEEKVSLEEVELSVKENPANLIIKKAISKRIEHLNTIDKYECQFYSKSLYKIKNAPKKILGQEVGDLGGGLDSTRTGIVYLSETISKISHQSPDLFKEHILASKVSGNDSGFSFNTASSVNFNFYNNTINIIEEAVSPIADFAFNYYKYQLEGVIYSGEFTINKIKVIPKRPDDRSFDGYIYIVDDSWEIYGVDLNLTGIDVFFPALDTLNIKQNFKYHTDTNNWILISQVFDFKYQYFGIKGDGIFSAVYKDYNFKPELNQKDFTNEVLLFEKEASKKNEGFWNTSRPLQLTREEKNDYQLKDSIQIIRKSKSYLDSTDRIKNKFKFNNLLSGYTYNNSFKNNQFSISSPLQAIQFNTVQGWNTNLSLSYGKVNKEKNTWYKTKAFVNYGLSDKKLRLSGLIAFKFNNFSKPILKLSGGQKLSQFNESPPISSTINSLSTLFFEDNYAKFFDKKFVQLDFSNEFWNGIHLYSKIAYEDRSPVFNTTDYVLMNQEDDVYTANNPIFENNYNNSIIDNHSVLRLNLSSRIRFNQKYYTYPDGKFNEYSRKLPELYLGAESVLTASHKNYQYGLLKARVFQNVNFKNKGRFVYNLKGGIFLNAENISFVDYKHFNGNLTHIGSDDIYVNRFNIMPYYQFSTNQNYFEGHVEHNFQGYVLNRLPVFKKLNYFLVVGAHIAATHNNKPYTEYSVGLENLGWGKFRFFRLDYTWSNYSGNTDHGILFGLKFLDLLNLN